MRRSGESASSILHTSSANDDRRNKISNDPNNTSWSKSENGYGQKILSAQGWKPGDYLGASNANHADHYTAANASHIRILLREENLGLGAQLGKGNAETFGLSLFSGVLGRLNGKSDAEVEKQQNAIRDAELRNYHVTKFGLMNFVSGGLLVGDTIQPIERDEVGERKRRAKITSEPDSDPNSKKQRRARDDNEINTSGPNIGLESSSSPDETHRSKKKDKKRSRRNHSASEVSTVPAREDPPRSKEEKRARKEERRKRKEQRRLRKSSSKAASSRSSEIEDARDTERSESGATTPSALSTNPRLVRRRYIDQKRMASLDPKAMKEIFMLSASA